ncbi:hypothetical protein K449DRAFT_17110 [Hypoxylon sp. EC38]|nr:hypothetical protein K449DRAFT_17110 [Hypoxylon sp. EC38]
MFCLPLREVRVSLFHLMFISCLICKVVSFRLPPPPPSSISTDPLSPSTDRPTDLPSSPYRLRSPILYLAVHIWIGMVHEALGIVSCAWKCARTQPSVTPPVAPQVPQRSFVIRRVTAQTWRSCP